MKRALPVLFFVCLAFGGFAQYDETESADSLAKKIAKRTELGKIGITIGGGLSWRVAQLPDDQNELTKAYYKDLLSGNGIDAGVCYYFNKRFGVGLRYNSFISKARVEDVVVTVNTPTGPVNKFGDVEDKTAISFYGATFGGRIANRPRTGYFFYQAGLGLITYRDDASAPDIKQIIKGNTPGVMISGGYTVVVTKNIGLGVGFNYASGALTEYTVTQDGQTRTQKLPEDQPEGLQHFDFKAELVIMF